MALPEIEQNTIEEELDGTTVGVPYKIQLLENIIDGELDEVELQAKEEDWSDVKAGVYIILEGDVPDESKGGIITLRAGCVQAGETAPPNTNNGAAKPKTKEETPADAAASLNPNNTGIKIGVNTSKLNEMQIETINCAIEWLKKGVPGQKWEDASGRGPLVDALKKDFGFRLGDDAWCAMFSSTVVRQAMKNVGSLGTVNKASKRTTVNHFYMTAGARDLVYGNPQPPLVGGDSSRIPEIGAIFHTPKAPGGKGSGHVGIVVGIDGPKQQIITCEGNASDRVCLHIGDAKKISTMHFTYPNRIPYSGKSRGSTVLTEIPELLKTAYLVGGKYKTR